MSQLNYTHWSQSGLDWDAPPYEGCSTNLISLREFLLQQFGGQNLGCHGDRPIRQGTAISSHSYGAALDWRYGANHPYPNPQAIGLELRDHVLKFLIDTHEQTGIQQIHDYYGDRIWKCDRDPNTFPDGWKKQNGAGSGMGAEWANYLHAETNLDFFNTKVDYHSIYGQWLNKENALLLGELEVLDEPFRLFDSRTNGVPLTSGTQTIPISAQVATKGVLVNITPVGVAVPGRSQGGYLGWNVRTSFCNWSVANDPRPNCIPFKIVNGAIRFHVEGTAHVLIDVVAKA